MIIKQKEIQTINQLQQLNTTDFQKIELTNNGTTPSKGMLAETIKYAHEKQLTVNTLIRPRQGKYDFNDIEIKIMEANIFEAQALGCDGIAFGAITEENKFDKDVLDQLIAAADGMQLILNHMVDKLNQVEKRRLIDFANEKEIDYMMITNDSTSSTFKEQFQNLIDYNQGNIQFILCGDNEEQLLKDATYFNIHQILIEK